MLPANRQLPIERPPSQIAGAAYTIIGFFALLVAAFVLLYQGGAGALSNFRIGLGIVIGLYGLFRIYTGITMIRRARKIITDNQFIMENNRSNPTDPTDIRNEKA